MAKLAQLAILLGCMLLSGSAFATTYYIAASGSDSSAGTSKTSPWLHAPGMTGCTATCAAKTPQPGDQFIFKGGDSWTSGSFPINLVASGTSGYSIYYGIDQTWFTGASWTRPVFDLQLTSGKKQVFNLSSGIGYVTIDNFEMKNLVIDNDNGNNAFVLINGRVTGVLVENNYIHKWTRTAGFTNDQVATNGGILSAVGGNDITVLNNLIDNSTGCGDCGSLIFGAGTAQGNTVHDAPQGINSTNNVIGNEVYNIANSFDPTQHENVVYMKGRGVVSGNKIHHMGTAGTFSGVVLYVDPSWSCTSATSTETLTVFNNVVYDTADKAPVLFQGERKTPTCTTVIDFYNNTLQFAGDIAINTSGDNVSVADVRNNHYIMGDPSGPTFCHNNSARSCGNIGTVTDNHNIDMSATTATNQGYVLANAYAPIGSTNGTVDVASDLSSVFTVDVIGVNRPQQSIWDAGAYEYDASGSNPQPPSGLAAQVY